MAKKQYPFAGYAGVRNRSDWLMAIARRIWREDGTLLTFEKALKFFEYKYKKTAKANLQSAIYEAKRKGLRRTDDKLMYILKYNEPKTTKEKVLDYHLL